MDAARDDSALAGVELVRKLDAQARGVLRTEARADLALGAGLTHALREFGLAAFGHSHARDMSRAQFGFSWAHARELMLLASKLADLPALRAAFLSGAVSRSRVRAVVRDATPETDAGWAQLCRGKSTRELEALVTANRAGRREVVPEVSEDDGDDHVEVRWRASESDAAAWRWGKTMLRQVMGSSTSDWRLAEALAADTLADLGPPEGDVPPSAPALARGMRRWPSTARRVRDADLRRLGAKARKRARIVGETERWPDPTAAETPADALEALLQIAARRHGLQWELARILDVIQARALYRNAGYRRFDEYLERSLGLSPREGFGAVRLLRRLDTLPALSEVFRRGQLSPSHVALLERLVTPESESQWVGYALRVPWKRLVLEVEWHLAYRGVAPHEYERLVGGRPQPERPVRKLVLDWREFFGCRERTRQEHALRQKARRRKTGACTVSESAPSIAEEDGVRATRNGPLRLARRVVIGFRAPESVARLWRTAVWRTRQASGWTLDEGECVHVMLIRFAHAHASPAIEQLMRAHAVLERDAWTCSMPHCQEVSGLHVHHVVFRSRGGSDDPSNLVALCERCHQGLVHEGWVQVRGEAPDSLTFVLGTRPGCPRSAWREELRVA